MTLIGLLAVSAATAAQPDLRPIAVHRTGGPIRVDGDLSDPGWKDAAVIDTFWETQPGDNGPPKVATPAPTPTSFRPSPGNRAPGLIPEGGQIHTPAGGQIRISTRNGGGATSTIVGWISSAKVRKIGFDISKSPLDVLAFRCGVG